MRAVKNNLPTPSEKVEESEGPRWTRARWETTRLPFQLLREKERHYGARRVIDQDALEKVQCLCFGTQYLRHFDVQVLNCWETTLHENR